MNITLKALKSELWSLNNTVDNDSRVRRVRNEVIEERWPRIKELEKLIAEAREERPTKKPRWPENTPANVLAICNEYWQGTTESYTFRIHCWNDKAVCTSYPSGGYSDNGGWNPTAACFHFLSLTEKEYGKPKRIGADLEGRQSQKKLEATLAERTK